MSDPDDSDNPGDTDRPEDSITAAFLSGSGYEQVRALNRIPFGPSLESMLARQAALLGVLSLSFPLFAAFPDSVAAYLPSTDPTVASPKILLLGVFGGVMTTFAAMVLVGVGASRLRNAPVDESHARQMIDFETFAAYVGFVTGGVSICITVAYFALGALGGEAVAGYVAAMDGVNPFAASGIALPVSHVAFAAFFAAVCLWTTSQYLSIRFVEIRATSHA